MNFTTSTMPSSSHRTVGIVNVCCTELDNVSRLGFVYMEPLMPEAGSRELI